MIFFPILFPMGGGAAQGEPRTSERFALVASGLLGLATPSAVCWFFLGKVGLLAGPWLFAFGSIAFAWAWLFNECMEHSMKAKGLMSGIFTAAAVMFLAFALATILGGFMIPLTVLTRS